MPGALILTERNKQMIKHGLCMNDREKQPEPEPEKIQEQLLKIKDEYEKLKVKYEHAKSVIRTMKQSELLSDDVPKNFMGFSVRRDKKGYIRGYKRIDGKMKSVYFGKSFSEKAAEKKIQQFSG